MQSEFLQDNTDKLLTVKEAAALLSVRERTIYAWKAENKIPFRKVGKLLRFNRAELLDWTMQQKEQPQIQLRVINF